ncbi:uncharacterized protein LOC144209981 isoform X2 [Stigmatopora nigra]
MDKETAPSRVSPGSGPSGVGAFPLPPAPPRLTPQPGLSPAPPPPPTAVTASPPPPLTPAPKVAAARTLSVPVPSPPKLSSPALHAYARPVLPCSPSSSLATATLTNGSARSFAVVGSNNITPFHTPASPPGRQQVPPPQPTNGSPQSQSASQQALLLGKVLKGAGQEQVLLQAQMNAAPTGGGPPSLRPKPPASVPAQPCRPQAALFPPLRPRPRAEIRTAPLRHLSVPPPTLYSPVRALPLRPKLQPAAPRAPPRAPPWSPALFRPPEPSPSAQPRIVAPAPGVLPLAAREALPLPPAPSENGARKDATRGTRQSGAALPDAVEVGRRETPDRAGDADAVMSGGGDADKVAASGAGTHSGEPLPEADGAPTPEVCRVAPEAPEQKAIQEEEEPRGRDVHGPATTLTDNRSASSGPSSPPPSPSGALNLSRRRRRASSEDEEGPGGGSGEPPAWPTGGRVLTHLVEGFVIQEGVAPFPVNRSSLLLPPEAAASPPEVNGGRDSATAGAEPSEHSADSRDGAEDPGRRGDRRGRGLLRCQFCGKRGHAHNFMRSKRFCSTSCARGFNVRLTKRLRALSAGRADQPAPVLRRARPVPGKPLLLRLPRDLWSAGRREKRRKAVTAAPPPGDGNGEDRAVEEGEERATLTESPPSVATAGAVETEPSQWSVEQVTAFVRQLPGCGGGEVSSAFRLQEIDGQALLLLTEEHLMSGMNLKLGPALKICAHINALKHP